MSKFAANDATARMIKARAQLLANEQPLDFDVIEDGEISTLEKLTGGKSYTERAAEQLRAEFAAEGLHSTVAAIDAFIGRAV